VTLEIFMFGIKGYRAREAAAKLRNSRTLVSEEVRAARYAVLPDKVAQPEADVEVSVTDETTNSTPAAPVEPAKEVEAEVTAPVEGAAEGEAEQPAAEVVDTPKEEAPKAEEPKAEPKPKAKHAKKTK
jgi:outer membrane biosynthesis protein TonB